MLFSGSFPCPRADHGPECLPGGPASAPPDTKRTSFLAMGRQAWGPEGEALLPTLG